MTRKGKESEGAAVLSAGGGAVAGATSAVAGVVVGSATGTAGAAAITSGLAAVGSIVGGGMIAEIGVVAAAPIAGAVAGFGV